MSIINPDCNLTWYDRNVTGVLTWMHIHVTKATRWSCINMYNDLENGFLDSSWLEDLSQSFEFKLKSHIYYHTVQELYVLLSHCKWTVSESVWKWTESLLFRWSWSSWIVHTRVWLTAFTATQRSQTKSANTPEFVWTEWNSLGVKAPYNNQKHTQYNIQCVTIGKSRVSTYWILVPKNFIWLKKTIFQPYWDFIHSIL